MNAEKSTTKLWVKKSMEKAGLPHEGNELIILTHKEAEAAIGTAAAAGAAATATATAKAAATGTATATATAGERKFSVKTWCGPAHLPQASILVLGLTMRK